LLQTQVLAPVNTALALQVAQVLVGVQVLQLRGQFRQNPSLPMVNPLVQVQVPAE